MMAVCLMAMLAAHEAPSAQDLLRDIQVQRRELRALSATFVQEDADPAGKRHEQGKVLYLAPHRILLQYESRPISYLKDGDRVYEYDGNSEQIQSYVLDDPELTALFLGFEADFSDLEKRFSLVPFTPGKEDCGARGLELTPKDDGVDGVFEKARICFDAKNLLPCQIEIIHDAGLTSRILFKDLKVNPTLTDKDVSILAPEGTAIVEDGRLVGAAKAGGRRFPEALEPGAPVAAPPAISATTLAPPTGLAQ